jgi:hypothetical protein
MVPAPRLPRCQGHNGALEGGAARLDGAARKHQGVCPPPAAGEVSQGEESGPVHEELPLERVSGGEEPRVQLRPPEGAGTQNSSAHDGQHRAAALRAGSSARQAEDTESRKAQGDSRDCDACLPPAFQARPRGDRGVGKGILRRYGGSSSNTTCTPVCGKRSCGEITTISPSSPPGCSGASSS